MPFGFCDTHERKWEWTLPEEGSTRKRFACPDCLSNEVTRTKELRSDLPLVRFSQTWGRDRPLTKQERAHPPRTRTD